VLSALEVNCQTAQLKNQGKVTQLIVDGAPFLMLAGELGNSSSSSTDYMTPIWAQLSAMHLNTVLVPVYWELLEPKEGKFDFTLVDSMIYAARKYNLKIVFLWFGSWKNSMSCYAPIWVKENYVKYPRARKRDGTAVEIISPFSADNLSADVNAFARFMRRIKETDSVENTVIMVQVENEIGMIPEARDYSEAANKAFTANVPSALIQYLQKNSGVLAPELSRQWNEHGNKLSGSWEEVFGKSLSTDELFMAWYFASYTNKVADAGKKAYPLPMYVNAALIREGAKPGQYPSAGPLPHLIDVWRAGAPAIDFIAPDIYFRSFKEWTARYDVAGNPLFIPEVGNDQSMTQAFYAFGKHNAMGYSPFSIESVSGSTDNKVARAYELLKGLTPLIIEHQGKGSMDGFLLDSIAEKVQIRLGNYIFNIKHEYSWPYTARSGSGVPRVGGLIIMLSPEEFIVAGSGVVVTFESALKDGSLAGIGSLDEGKYVDGKWIAARRMNGDQSHQGRHMHLPGSDYGIQRVRMYGYK
jgi:hypothetical protein